MNTGWTFGQNGENRSSGEKFDLSKYVKIFNDVAAYSNSETNILFNFSVM